MKKDISIGNIPRPQTEDDKVSAFVKETARRIDNDDSFDVIDPDLVPVNDLKEFKQRKKAREKRAEAIKAERQKRDEKKDAQNDRIAVRLKELKQAINLNHPHLDRFTEFAYGVLMLDANTSPEEVRKKYLSMAHQLNPNNFIVPSRVKKAEKVMNTVTDSYLYLKRKGLAL